MLIDFTEFELETIAAAMDDYINYDDENLSNDELIGGQSVEDRVTSIQNKIDSYFILKNQRTFYTMYNFIPCIICTLQKMAQQLE